MDSAQLARRKQGPDQPVPLPATSSAGRSPSGGPAQHASGATHGQCVRAHDLIVAGFDEIVVNKYLSCITKAVEDGFVTSYSIIDLESQREAVERRLYDALLQPSGVVFLPDSLFSDFSDEDEQLAEIHGAVAKLSGDRPVKMYIATEVRAHEIYLKYCVEQGVQSLVEKPVIAPVTNGRFNPELISGRMAHLSERARESGARVSVMTLGRYHRIYNDEVIDTLSCKMTEWQAPITSLHLRVAGGVWNLQREFEMREDHPYTYGYGMLFHGAYHYIDIAAQCLSLNRIVYPEKKFRLELSSFGAFPGDQCYRIPRPAAEDLGDERPLWNGEHPADGRLGETDIVSTFRLLETVTGRTLTVGSLAFEQTTPSIRKWANISDQFYNKNGRTSSVDLEAQLSVLLTSHANCYDAPTGADVDRVGACALVTTRANGALIPTEDYTSNRSFSGVFHSDSNRRLMLEWLRDRESRSLLDTHVNSMRLLEALAASLLQPGRPTVVDDF